MELRHFRYFLAVAEQRNFGRAARELGIAQPPLSRQIQALEAEIGVLLFDRSQRQIALTDAGRTLVEESRRVFLEVDRAVHRTQRAARGETGRISVGYVSSVAYSGLPEVLRAFRKERPGVEIRLEELPPADQVKALRARDLDVGFVRAPVEVPELDTFMIRKEAFVAALPKNHPLARHREIDVRSLAEEPFVLFQRWRGPAFFDQIITLCARAGFSPRIEQEAPMMDVLSLVAAGFGVSIVAESSKRIRLGDVIYRPFSGHPMTALVLAWRKDDASKTVRTFVDAVRRIGMKLGEPRAQPAKTLLKKRRGGET